MPFCKLFAGLGSTNKSATSFVLSDSCSVFSSIFYLNFSGRSGRNCLFSLPVLLGSKRSPNTRFSQGTMRLMSWPDGERYLCPSAIPCSFSPLISRIYSSLFSDWKRTVSSKFFDTQVPSIATKELVFPRHARCVLSRLHCNGHSLLLSSYLCRIGRIENPSCSACDTRPRTPFISFCIVQLRTLCAARFFGDFLSLYDLWSRPWGVARLLELHGLPPCSHPSEWVG